MVGHVESTLPRAMFTSRARDSHVPRWFLVYVLSLWLSLSAAQALDPSKRLTQYAHTAWQTQDVAEDFHGPFTQTADGYFWFGTASGLTRFDGVTFVSYAPPDLKLPSRGYQYLLGARDGSLWIGTTSGLGRLKDGKFQWYSDPAKHNGIVRIFEDKKATIWVTRYHAPREEGPLCRVEGTRLHCFGKNDGIPAAFALGLTEDSAGYLWFGSDVLYRWRAGSPATAYLNELADRQDAGEGVHEVAVGESGTVWAAINATGAGLGVRYLSGGKWAPYVIPGFDGSKFSATGLYVDRKGLLWIGTDSGIYRVRNGRAEHYGIAEGLSGKSARSFYEDREGNLWVRTDTGIDKFRDIPVITYSTREGLSGAGIITVLGLQDGSLWVGNGSAIDILSHEEHSVLSAKEGLPGTTVGALYQDHRAVVWLGVNGRLMSYDHGRFKEFKRPDGSSIAKGALGAITEDANHTIWALTPRHELFRVKDQTAYLVISVSSDNRPGGYLAPDRKGGLWIGSINGALTYYRDGQTSTISIPAQGSEFTLMDLAVDSDDSLLLSTSEGLFRWDNQHWQVLNHRNGVPEGAVFTAIRDDVGALWLYAQRGLVRITKAEYDNWLGHSDRKLQTEVFGKFDGLRPRLTVLPEQPMSTKTRDGKLWFAASDVLQMVDPTQTYRNGIAPPVRIERVIADHKDYPVAEMLRLPALTRDVEIDYTALSFAAPQKVQFRYMLLDRDSHWQDAATRRRAFYSNLGPGNYRFRVIACNNDGVWNEAGATLDFSVVPAWYQSGWFRSSIAAALLLGLWGTYQLRVKQLQRQFNVGLEARVNERTRIARELHDTLLQNFHGLMFQFQAASTLMLRRPDEAKKSLDDAIVETKKAIAESRDAIQGLRSEPIAKGNLAELLASTSRELAEANANEHQPVFDLVEEGERRTLSPAVSNDICRTALELMRNAYQHAHARRIEAEIRYGDSMFRLRIRDDGKGIEPNVIKEGGRVGHWGLRGIRERADRIGARLEVWSEPGNGTEVQLLVPASIAYESFRDSYRAKLVQKVKSRAKRS
jgi:signal transduction histidine kinase/ligand-binding sensor domain-containing protein